ncbi:GxxExxY protein [Geothrix sp. 21YS21S-4]|uniref:GxxExxY protein n=1 Tax=Geothrix sp. 21YS21S-4 TaxID=3068889 RepID=UPI0027BB1806|nr:GxxExxY protein [Geothrix sp. 21YS21S-4]
MERDLDGLNGLSQRVIAACIEVHRSLGPGLLESAYEVCLARELALAGIPFQRQVAVPVSYKGAILDAGYRIDLLVEGRLIVELKAARSPINLLRAQVLTYLKLMNLALGLGVNFNQVRLVDGVTRVIHTSSESA